MDGVAVQTQQAGHLRRRQQHRDVVPPPEVPESRHSPIILPMTRAPRPLRQHRFRLTMHSILPTVARNPRAASQQRLHTGVRDRLPAPSPEHRVRLGHDPPRIADPPVQQQMTTARRHHTRMENPDRTLQRRRELRIVSRCGVLLRCGLLPGKYLQSAALAIVDDPHAARRLGIEEVRQHHRTTGQSLDLRHHHRVRDTLAPQVPLHRGAAPDTQQPSEVVRRDPMHGHEVSEFHPYPSSACIPTYKEGVPGLVHFFRKPLKQKHSFITENSMTPTPPSFRVRKPDARIELAAQARLRACLQRTGLASIPVPVPVETWIETPLGYRFGIAGPEELPPNVLGMARLREGEILISESLLEHEGRYRFTCAHELAHMVLHRHLAETLVDEEVPSLDDEQTGLIEREADRFAAAVLVPLETLPDAFESIRRGHGLDPACYELLRSKDIRTLWLWHRVFLPALADRYRVSKAAMIYRCREIRLARGRRLVMPSMIPLLVVPPHRSGLDLSGVRVENGMPVTHT